VRSSSMLGSRQGSRGSQLAPLKCASPSRSNAQSRGSTASATGLDDGRSSIRSSSVSGAAEPLPSHIPPEFHIREDGVLVFPSRRPQGDEDVPRLERVLQDMLSAWNGRLEQHRFSVTIDDTPWSLMQMIVYDIWCTIEETRIYDIAFVESLRMTHFYSASLALFLGKIRTRIAQSFGSMLTMSRRLEVEMQRVQASWTDTGRLYHEEVGMRHAAEHHIRHLEAKLAMLETRTLAESKGSLLKNGNRTDQAIKQAHDEEKKGEALIRLQSEVLTLTKQVLVVEVEKANGSNIALARTIQPIHAGACTSCREHHFTNERDGATAQQ